MGGDSKIHIKPSIRDIRFKDTGFGDIRFGIVINFWDFLGLVRNEFFWFGMSRLSGLI